MFEEREFCSVVWFVGWRVQLVCVHSSRIVHEGRQRTGQTREARFGKPLNIRRAARYAQPDGSR